MLLRGIVTKRGRTDRFWDGIGREKRKMQTAMVTCSGRLFQTWAAATQRARSPTVDSRVRLTISDKDEFDKLTKLVYEV